MSSQDLEPRHRSTLAGKIDSVLAVLILVGIGFGVLWLAAGLASAYIWFFS